MPLAYEIERLLVRVVGDTAPYQEALRQAVEATRGFASAAAATASGAAKAFAALTAPVAAFAAKAGQSSASFEHAMAMIEGLAGQSREQVSAWSKEILDIAPEVGKAPEELAKGLYFFVSGGLRGAQAMDALKLASKASAAGMGDVATIARPVKAAMNAYAASGLTAAEATDTLVAAVQQSKLDAEALAPVIGRIIPLASSIGVSFSEALGPMAAMTRTGASAAEASTALQALFTSLLKPAKQSEAIVGSVGLSFEELRNVVRGPNGVINVMRILEKAFGGNEAAMARAFPNVRALRGVVNLLSQDGEKVNTVLDGVRNSAGALGVAFGAVARTGMFKAEQRMAQIKAIFAEVGDVVRDVMSPAMAAFGETLRALQSVWRGLGEDGQRTVIRWVAAAAGIVALMGALKGLTMLLGVLKIGQLLSAALWAVWTTALLVAKVALWAFNITLGLLKLGLTGAVIAGTAWWVVVGIVTAATWLWNAALLVLNALISPAAILGTTAVVLGLGAAFAGVAGIVLGVWQAGSALVGTLATLPTTYGPIQHISDLFREWGGILGEIWALMQTDGPAAWRLLAAAANLAFAQIQALLPPLWQFIKEGFFILWDMVVQTFDAKFTTTINKAKVQLGVLYGMSERTAKEQQAQDEVAARVRESAANLAAKKLDKLTQGFRVPESEAVDSARKAMDDMRKQISEDAEWSALLDEVDAMFGVVGQDTVKATQKMIKDTGGGIDLLANKGKKVKDSLRVDAVDFFSAEAQSRLDAYREAFAPSLAGTSKTSKSEDYLRQIAQNTQKTADEPGFDIEGADFEE